ncbi:MAG: dienelactone hydrolase family protein [Acidobacteria bacterium]|nr:dienelactone hydrolase family protein [Acidobacteriota bacterium]
MNFLTDGPEDASRTLILAHGAGGGMKTAFLAAIARGLGERGIRVVRFEFPYLSAGKKVPDREPILLDAWREAVRLTGDAKELAIGGKSMGGRMASMVSDELGVRRLLCLGYPFHPPGKPEKLRTAHLASLRTPTLIVQGTRDQFGTREDVAGYELSKSIHVEWLEGADHSYRPREKENTARAIELAASFLD